MSNSNNTAVMWLIDVMTAIFAGAVVAAGFHFFIIYNGFVPGGVNGLATILYAVTGINAGYFSIMLNLPIFVMVFFLVKKRTGVILTVYLACHSLIVILLDRFNVPYYDAQGNVLLAAIAGGVVTGFGFGLMIRQFGSSGGTSAIASIIRRKRPTASVVWLSFVMDSIVVVIAFFALASNIESALCTFINLFIASKVAEVILQGVKIGYKYEIVTENPDELSHDLIEHLDGSVTRLPAQGMYTGDEKSLLVCVIRKRNIAEFQRILKKYPNTFVLITKVTETMGGRFNS